MNEFTLNVERFMATTRRHFLAGHATQADQAVSEDEPCRAAGGTLQQTPCGS